MKESIVFPNRFPSLEEGWNVRTLMSAHPVSVLLATIVSMVAVHAWTTYNSSVNKLPHANPYNFFSATRVKVRSHRIREGKSLRKRVLLRCDYRLD
jgi:phosphoglycerate-specific signal transduction histidine kinase